MSTNMNTNITNNKVHSRKFVNRFVLIREHQGFTLVELIVAVGLFSVIVSIAIGGFVRAFRTQRQVAGLIVANSNVSLALEQMAREIRTGRNFCRPDAQGNPTCPPSPSDRLVFVNSAAETVTYRLNGDVIERGVGSIFENITGDNVNIRYLRFILFGHLRGDGWPPRITVSVGVSSKKGGSEAVVSVQTTVSARLLDS